MKSVTKRCTVYKEVAAANLSDNFMAFLAFKGEKKCRTTLPA